MNDIDKGRLDHIFESARLIQGYIQGLDWSVFKENTLVQDAVIRRLEIIAEASKHLSPAARDQLRAVPFTAIRGLRNRLLHDYENVALERVWSVAVIDLPALLLEVERTVKGL